MHSVLSLESVRHLQVNALYNNRADVSELHIKDLLSDFIVKGNNKNNSTL